MKTNPEVTAAYEAMKAAEAAFRAERSDEAKAIYDAANAAYNSILPQRGSFHSRDNTAAGRSGRRQHAERMAMVAASQAKRWR